MKPATPTGTLSPKKKGKKKKKSKEALLAEALARSSVKEGGAQNGATASKLFDEAYAAADAGNFEYASHAMSTSEFSYFVLLTLCP